MVTPVINNIVPFDAGVGTVFTFQYTGGITDSYFEIFDIANTLIYDSRDDARLGISQLKQRTIPSATNDYVDGNGVIVTNPLSKMVNDAQYYIQLTVINGEETSTSQKRLFRCITTPLLSVFNNDGTNDPLEDSYILTSANLELYTTYTQGIVNNSIYEDLNCYQFILYNNNYQKIYTSDVYYNLTDDKGTPIYTRISGLEEKRYFLKVVGKTINGYVIDNDFVTIDVKYKASPQKTTLLVENCLDEGFVKIGTNIHALLYRLKYSPAKFVDDVIQLRDNWLEYYDGLTIDGDYVAYVRFKNPNYNTNLVHISGNGHDVYMNCYKHDTYMSMVEIEETYGDILLDEDIVKGSYLYFDLRIYTENKVEMLVSDKFSVDKMEDAWFNAYIVRKGSTYSFLVIPDKYKMTYVLNGALNDDRNPLNYREGDELYLYSPKKRGNMFGGWYSSSSFESSSTRIFSPFIAPGYDMTVYAKLAPKTYNISYNIPIGAIHTNPETYTYGTTTILLDAEKTGYDFIGWYTDNEYVNQITEISSDEIDDKILYGNFEPKVYSMIYNLNGGENNDKNPNTYTTDAEVILYNPARDGYDFGGWYYDSSFNNPVNNPFIAPASNTTVYARWTAKTYNINYVNAVVENTNPTTYTYGTTTTLRNLTRTGYTFNGWYLDEECSEKITSISSTTYGDLTLYAKWTPIYYSITYNTTYKDDIANITITSNNGGNPTQYCIEDNIPLLDGVINNSSYEFEGWYVGNSVYCDYSTKITEIDGSTQSGVLYLYPKVIAKEWFVYAYNNSTMTATLKFTNKATEMNEFYVPAEYNGYKVSSINFPSNGVDHSITNKLNTASKFIIDENNEYYFSDDDGNVFHKYSSGSTLFLYMDWYNDANSYCKESIFTNAIEKAGTSDLRIQGSAFLGHNGLQKIAICDNVRTYAPSESKTSSIKYQSSTFKGCENLAEIYFTTSSTTSTHCASRASYYTQEHIIAMSVDSYVKSGGYCGSNWQPTKSCTVYVKDSSISVGKDSKQTISTDYDWELPDELK